MDEGYIDSIQDIQYLTLPQIKMLTQRFRDKCELERMNQQRNRARSKG